MTAKARRWTTQDPRAFLWLGSAAIHAAFVAIILMRAPFGLADLRHTRLATAPNIELGVLPTPVTSPSTEAVEAAEAPPSVSEVEPQAEPSPPVMSEAEPQAEPSPPVMSEVEPQAEPTQQVPTTAAIAPTPPEPIAPPVIEDLAPAMETRETEKPIEPEKPVAVPETKPKPVESSPRQAPSKSKKPRAVAARPARPSGTMAGARSESAQTGAARASYGALLRAEIMRRRIYPADAASRGDEGVVVARVTIGPSGTALSHAVVKSSGIASFDRAVPRIMASLSLPPPPDGSYTATVAIRFALE